MSVESHAAGNIAVLAAPRTRFIVLGLLIILPLIGAIAPRALSWVVPLTGLIAYAGAWIESGKRPALHLRPFFYVLPVLLMAALSSLWAIDPDLALERSGKIALILIPGALLAAFLLKQDAAYFKGFAGPFLAVLGAALLLNILEMSLLGPLYEVMRGDNAFSHSSINRHVVAVMLTVAAGFTFYRAGLGQGPKTYIAGLVLAALIVTLAFLTYSQSSIIALILMSITMLAFPARISAFWLLVALLVPVLIYAAPILSQYMFYLLPPYISDISFFQHSYATKRLEIWDFIGRYALENPLIGHGIEATRAVEAFDTKQLYFGSKTVLHPHNFALQIWIEFGVLGATLASLFTVYLLDDIRGLTPRAAKTALATFIGCMAVGATGYGLWQGWWLGTFMMLWAYCIIALKLDRSSQA